MKRDPNSRDNRLKKMEEIMSINEKLFNVRSKVGKISKDADNPFYKSKWVEGFEGRYVVSGDGKIFSVYRNGKHIEMKQAKQRNGYHLVRLYNNSEKKDMLVSRIVANHFVENPNNYKEVNHKDGNKSNNCFSNLEWCTRSQNVQHSFDTGIRVPNKGEKVSTSKLSETDVLDIINAYNIGCFSQSEIARAYNVTPSNIYSIVNNKTWSHL